MTFKTNKNNWSYTLIIQHKSREIVRKELTEQQINKITGLGASWIIAAFKEHFSLDVSKYRLEEWSNMPGSLTIEIREGDLVAFRLKKIEDLGI